MALTGNPLNRDLVEDAIFGWRGSQRFTQDSPVLPDVWIEYAQNPGRAVGLLLEPSGGTSPATIYKALADKLGASGARLLLSLITDLELQQSRYGLATMCIGVGQGIATIVERL